MRHTAAAPLEHGSGAGMADSSLASPSAVGSASWASKLAERVARTQYDFVRVSIADSERRITDLISSSEHRLRSQLTEIEQNLRREMRPRRGLSQEVSPVRSIADGRLDYSDFRSRATSTSSELAPEPLSPTDEAERLFSSMGATQQRPKRMRRNILPEPRVLGLVGDEDPTPPTIFKAAFEKSGGQAAVTQWNEMSNTLQRHIADAILDVLVSSILPTSRSEGSSSGCRPLHQHYTPDFRTLHTQGSAVLSGFNARVQAVAARSKGRPIFSALKSELRATIKSKCRYTCHDKGDVAWYRLTDIVRATISYPDIPQMYQGLQVASQEFGSAVRAFADRYLEPTPCGYRSLELIVEHDGHLCEVILNTEVMFASKEAVGPLAHEARADLAVAVRNGDAELVHALLDWIDCSSSLDSTLPNILNEPRWSQDSGGSFLHAAARQGNHKVVHHLLLYAADANIQDKDENTPLHIALQCGHEQVTWTLLDLGRANPRMMNSASYPALMLGLEKLWSQPEKEGPAKAVQTLAYYAGAEHVREVVSRHRELGYDKLPQTTAKELKFEAGVEELDAASLAAEGPKRSIRTRVNTGFEWAPSSPADNRTGLRFDDKAEAFDAASEAVGEAKRSIRTRINTGFAFKEAEEPKESKLQFSQDVTMLDAASSAADGPRRNVRTRINTGFAFKKDAPPDDRPQLQFTGGAEVFDAASESSNAPHRSIRDRVNTGFAFEPSKEPKDRELQFDENAEQLDAASLATNGATRSVRARVNTGFARESDVAAHENSGRHLEFDDTPEHLEAASSASNNPAKSVRARINTGFVREGGENSEEDKDKGLQFNEDVEELDAASYASGSSGRPVRTRVNTGFVKDHAVPEEKEKGLNFDDNVVELEAASTASGGSSRSVRTRVNTGFVKDSDEVEEKSPGLQFSDDVEHLEAASSASGGSGRSVRTRVNTGFVRESDPKEVRQGLTFDDEVEHFDAASAASGTGRPVRSRVNTGYVKEEDEPPKQRGLEFDDDVQEFEAASAATGGSGRSVRTRVNTGFVKEADEPEPQRPGLTFDDEVEQLDAASEAVVGGASRSVRARVNTGFARDGDVPKEERRGLQFDDVAEEVEAASHASGGSARSVRTRVNTGFVKESDAPAESPKAIQFVEDAEELEAASSANGTKKSVRTRVNTGFITQADEDTEDRAGIQFSEDVEQLDAASESTGALGRSVRTRVNTGFVRGGDAPTGQRLQFDDDVEEGEAASAATGAGRSVRTRINTGYVKQQDKPEQQGIKFGEDVEEIDADAVEEIDAAGEAFSGAAFSVSVRRSPKLQKPKEEQKSLKFSEDAEELDAASEATGAGTKSVRARVNTGFVKSDEVPSDERRGLHFDEQVEEVDAASESTDGAARSVRTRVNTGYVKHQDAPKEQGLKFSEDVEELDAASGATDGDTRSVRARVNTGYVKDGDVKDEDDDEQAESHKKVGFQCDAEELEAASVMEIGQPRRSVRDRVSTGYAGKPLIIEERRSSAERQSISDSRRSSRKNSASSSRGSVAFSEHQEIEAADHPFLSSDMPMRQLRSRKSTGFSESGGNEPTDSSENESEDGTASQASSRPSLLQRRLSTRRASRMTGRKLSLQLAAQALEEKRKIQHMTIFGAADKLAEDSPEMYIDDRMVDGAEKDDEMLLKSLRPLPLFEDIDDQSLMELIEDMSVFEYGDKEEVVRQGDTGGTHFFVVAQGKFEIIKNEKVVVELEPGDAFGESVLLIDGSRTATVRAMGTARVYGMEAEDVRDVLRYTYQMEHKQVMNAIENILEAERCDQFRKLNAFQLHKLYMDASVATYESGKVILQSTNTPPEVFSSRSSSRSADEDEEDDNIEKVWVLVQGAIVLRDGGRDVARVKRYTMFGMRRLVFNDAPLSAVADGSTKCLVLSKKLLEEVYGVAKVPTVLLGSDVDQALGEKTSLTEDMREAMAKSFVVQEISQGKDLDTIDVRFVMCLHGDVEVSTDGFASDIRLLRGSNQDIVGLDQLLQSDRKWDIQVRAANKDVLTYIAVWCRGDVDIRGDELKEKLKILKSVFLFKTLSVNQIRNLGESMSTENYKPDETIVSQGDMGKTFYIIGSGRVSIEKSGRYIRALSKGDFFGERALLNNEPRSATIIAAEACTVWAITSQTFQEVMPKASLDYLKGRMGLQDTEYTFDDFTMIKVIGTGGFGIVKMVELTKGNKTRYALKCVKKRPIVELNQQESLVNERSILAGIDHPFIIRLVQSFRNEAFVYFLTEIVGGGELLDALSVLGLLNMQQTQFYAASILLAFEHIHERRVAYLDLKSENVLIDYQGYIKLIDFGLAVKIHGGHCHTVKGTPHFMAPEMILGKGYDTMADLWALGICIYEFMLGELPFGNSSSVKAEIFRAVLKAPLVFPDSFRQKPYAEDAMDLIKGFLTHKPNQRLGGGIEGYAGITGHPFLAGVDWDGLIARFVDPPFVPQKEQYSANSPTTEKPEPLAKHEAAEEAKEMKSGWADPDPGWDDDFC